MITTKGAARFHANGFVAPQQAMSNNNCPLAMVPNDNMNSAQGTKRLASCREELERSWGTVAHHQAQDTLHCVSSDGGLSEGDDYTKSRVKRRRTGPGGILLPPSSINNNAASSDDVNMDCSSNFVRGNRISPTNRPHYTHKGVRTSTHQVKAGWYEGEIDVYGNRHGRGCTKHDDGTEYEGEYLNDEMEGPDGRYQFVTTRQLVRGSGEQQLHRQIEKSFVGNFKEDKPHGAGMIITKTIDCAPQVLGSTPLDVRHMEIVYDVGMHNRNVEGKAVGEGIRIIYSNTITSTASQGGIVRGIDGRSSTLEQTCYRLNGGECTDMKVAQEYAAWILQCMGLEWPSPPSMTNTNLYHGASWSHGGQV